MLIQSFSRTGEDFYQQSLNNNILNIPEQKNKGKRFSGGVLGQNGTFNFATKKNSAGSYSTAAAQIIPIRNNDMKIFSIEKHNGVINEHTIECEDNNRTMTP